MEVCGNPGIRWENKIHIPEHPLFSSRTTLRHGRCSAGDREIFQAVQFQGQEEKHSINKPAEGAEVIPWISQVIPLWISHLNSVYPTKFSALSHSAVWDQLHPS